MADAPVKITPGINFRIALGVAVAADILQFAVIPLLGAASPPDDVLAVVIGAFLTWLLGWHWEFAPSFLGKLVPGVDLVPFWTLGVANVYRKKKRLAVTEGVLQDQQADEAAKVHNNS
jgi:hypothetical protein